MPAACPALVCVARIFRRSPGLAVGVAVTIAVGLGGCLAILGLLQDSLLAELPYQDASRLVVLSSTGKYHYEGRMPEGLESRLLSEPDFRDLQGQARTLSVVGGWRTCSGFMRGGQRPIPVWRLLVTEKLMPLLAPPPLLGRSLNEADFAPGATPAAMITASMWRSALASDPNIIGRTIHIDDQAFSLVGVLPNAAVSSLRQPSGLLEERQDEWVISPHLPDMAGTEAPMVRYAATQRDGPSLEVVGRIAAGRTLADVQTEARVIAARLAGAHPGANKGRGLNVQPLEEWRVQQVRGVATLLLAAAILVFLVASWNAAGLILADSVRHEAERAVRHALGAGPSWLVLTEFARSLVLALPGGLLAVGVATLTLVAVDRFVAGATSDLARSVLIPRVVLAAALFTLLAGLLAGAGAAWSMRRQGVYEALKEGAASSSVGRRRHLAMRGLVALQVAAATALALGAGLMFRSVWNILSVDIGFDVRHNVLMEVRLPSSRYATGEQQRTFVRSALARARAIPGVTAAGMAGTPPLTNTLGLMSGLELVTPERTLATPDRVFFGAMTPGYAEALGMKLVRGRLFSEDDWTNPAGAALVDRAFCETHLAGADPLEVRLRLNRRLVPIIGVVGDVRGDGPLGESRPMLYMLERFERPERWAYLVVRGDGKPADIGRRVMREVIAVDPEVSVGEPQTADQLFAATFATRRRLTALLGTAAVLALVLTAFSLVSVLAQFVAGRRREIAIRLALGGGRRHVAGILARHIGLALALGMAGGAIAGVLLAYAVSSELYGVMPTDGATLVAALLALAALASLGAAVPGWRASGIDPARTLRSE
jgi:predicted permease